MTESLQPSQEPDGKQPSQEDVRKMLQQIQEEKRKKQWRKRKINTEFTQMNIVYRDPATFFPRNFNTYPNRKNEKLAAEFHRDDLSLESALQWLEESSVESMESESITLQETAAAGHVLKRLLRGEQAQPCFLSQQFGIKIYDNQFKRLNDSISELHSHPDYKAEPEKTGENFVIFSQKLFAAKKNPTLIPEEFQSFITLFLSVLQTRQRDPGEKPVILRTMLEEMTEAYRKRSDK